MKNSAKRTRIEGRIDDLGQTLVDWFQEAQRPLPWRQTHDPYAIWISEVMLQQTTVQAVLPYYERFLKAFPTLEHLAESSIESVYQNWSGLGYYSRARNLHKSAKLLRHNFPKTFNELLDFPGFGPYTARAVSSFAFDEPVGVLDGNIIRTLTRVFDQKIEWWKPGPRAQLQELADLFARRLANKYPPKIINQAWMELGATICTAKSPSCLTCPISKNCSSFKSQGWRTLPLQKPKPAKEIWLWKPVLLKKGNKVALLEEHSLPFLKDQPVFPGQVQRWPRPPKRFHFRHSITKHDIYISVEKKLVSKTNERNLKWVKPEELSKIAPSNLLQKVLKNAFV